MRTVIDLRAMWVHVRQHSRWSWTAEITKGSYCVRSIHATTERRLRRKVDVYLERYNGWLRYLEATAAKRAAQPKEPA